MTLERELKKTLHKDLIRKILKKTGYHGRVAGRKSHITCEQSRAFRFFSNKYVNKPPKFWVKILFSDKRKFCIFGIKGRKLVWRIQGTAFEKQNLVPTCMCMVEVV